MKSGLHFSAHRRHAVRKGLHALPLDRQISWQGLVTRTLPLLEVDSSGWRYDIQIFQAFLSLLRWSLCYTLAFDEPYVLFPRSKMFKAHQGIKYLNQFLKEPSQVPLHLEALLQ